MRKLRRTGQWLVAVGGWLTGLSAVAQPTVISERKNVPRFPVYLYKTLELPGHRFVHCGDIQVRSSASTGKRELAFIVTTLAGDTVRYRHLNVNPAATVAGGDYFFDAALGPDGLLTFLSGCPVPNPVAGQPAVQGYVLTQLDTLGNLRWRRPYPLYPTGAVVSANALLQVPDGYLVLANGVSAASTATATYTQGGVAKFDRQGQFLWQRTWPSRGYAGVGNLGGLVARPDGSYLATGFADSSPAYNGGPTSPRLDYWLVQFTPQGDTIRTARFGVNSEFETGYSVHNTADGGAAIRGARQLPTTGANRDATLVKVDSLLRPQWTYNQPNPSGSSEYFAFVQPMRGGDLIAGGGRYVYATGENYGHLTAFSASGTQRWNWQHHYANNPYNLTGYTTMVGQPDGSAYLAGGYLPSYSATVGENLFTRAGNVGVPYVPDWCAVPPRAVVGFSFTAGGDSLRLVNLSTAGPRYAALALWRWDFGDGTFFDGPAPPSHHYAAPGAGTRVTLTITNNLGCTSTQAVFPFALATTPARALAAGARLWPNPAAGAAVLEVPGLRAQPPVRLEVVNALGQVVAGQAVPVRQGLARAELELRALPAGVYALRLHAQEGTVVKRLVRQ